ncbi:MAG: nucleotidyltransferase family protein [Bacteroidales bacterium]|nr:nucleotidyltransferase family protein [Bacteroidales bacterium]
MTELQLAYNLLRAALDGSVPHVGDTPPEASRWWSLFRLLQRNNVAALCYDAAAAAGAPRQVLMPWLAEREKAVDRHRYQRQVQDDIVEKMRAHGIQTLVLKGTHTAQYYPKSECREFGDLDLYFYDRHADADKVACREFGVDLSNDSHHHTKYDYRGVTVESHYDFVNVHYPPSNRRYEALLKSLVDKKDQLPTTHYPLPTTHYPLPTTHYPLSRSSSCCVTWRAILPPAASPFATSPTGPSPAGHCKGRWIGSRYNRRSTTTA